MAPPTRLNPRNLRPFLAVYRRFGAQVGELSGWRALAQVSVGRTLLSASRASAAGLAARSEEHTSELQSLMRISYAVFCLKKKKTTTTQKISTLQTQLHNVTTLMI